MKEAHGVRQRVLDEHALSIAGDELTRGGIGIICQQDGRLVVAELLDEKLAKGALCGPGLLLVDTRCAVFAMRDVEGDLAPSRWWQFGDFDKQSGRAPAQGHEGDVRRVEAIEPGIGGEL